jgi:hypothetical protein
MADGRRKGTDRQWTSAQTGDPCPVARIHARDRRGGVPTTRGIAASRAGEHWKHADNDPRRPEIGVRSREDDPRRPCVPRRLVSKPNSSDN